MKKRQCERIKNVSKLLVSALMLVALSLAPNAMATDVENRIQFPSAVNCADTTINITHDITYEGTTEKGLKDRALKVMEKLNVDVSLADYITANEKGLLIDTYSFANNETLSAEITTGVARDTYTIGMNGHDLTKNIYSNITISNGKTLTINGGGGTISNFNTAFINNGILNLKNLILKNNYGLASPKTNTEGGAIYNTGSLIVEANFNKNTVGSTPDSFSLLGGAIYNNITNDDFFAQISGSFTENNVCDIGGDQSASDRRGGAIYNNKGIVLIVSKGNDIQFSKNYVRVSDNPVEGGAIYNKDRIKIIANSGNITFNKNYTSSSKYDACGGAIYNEKSLDIFAENSNITFSSNYVTGKSGAYGGAIYNCDGSTTNLYANEGHSVTFTGDTTGLSADAKDVDGIYNSSVLNINYDGTNTYKGMVNLNNVLSNIVNSVTNIYDGIVTSNETIAQKNMNIYGGELSINAGNLNIKNAIQNAGVIKLGAGTLNNAIIGDGSIITTGNVSSNAAILAMQLQIQTTY